MINILFAAHPEQFELYEAPLRQGLAQQGIHAKVTTQCAPADIDYIVYAPNSTLQDFTPYTRCKAVLSLWAGVEKIVGNASLTQPLCRMVDRGLRQGMVEWVVGHTLRYHLGMDQHIVNPNHIWRETLPPLAQDRPITILGLGALGQACAAALTALKFPVSVWSRRLKKIDGLTCHHGPNGLQAALQSAELLIVLLPDTP
jgi:glyoxylate/hydroxypyruvate reductase A